MQEFLDMDRAYIICQLNIRLVFREVHNRTTSSDVEKCYIIFPIDSFQALCVLEKKEDRLIVQEFCTFFVAFEFLKQIRSSWWWPSERCSP
jgi:hypothetical protein